MNQSRTLDYGYQSDAFYSGYYHHSGKVNFPGVAASILAGLAVGFVLAWLYVLADLYIPIVQLNLLAVLAFGAAVGIVPAMIMRKLKVRNVAVTLAVVALVTLFAYYITWAAWEWMLVRNVSNAPSFLQVASAPRAMMRFAVQINAVGTWKMSEHDEEATKGVFLSIVWIVEASLIFGFALFLSRSIASDMPFCEHCDCWCSPKRKLLSTGSGEASLLRQHLEAKDFTFLATLGPPTAARSWDFLHHRCEKCDQLHTLSVLDVTTKWNRKGKAQRKTRTLVNKLLLSPEDVQTLSLPKPVPPAAALTMPVARDANQSAVGTLGQAQAPSPPKPPTPPAIGLAGLASLDE